MPAQVVGFFHLPILTKLVSVQYSICGCKYLTHCFVVNSALPSAPQSYLDFSFKSPFTSRHLILDRVAAMFYVQSLYLAPFNQSITLGCDYVVYSYLLFGERTALA